MKVKIATKSYVTLHQKTDKKAELCVNVSRDFDRTEKIKHN